MIKKLRNHAVLTEHVVSKEDQKLQADLESRDKTLFTQFILYFCAVAIYYALLHLVFPDHWPLYEILSTTLGIIPLLSKDTTYRMVGWFLIAASALSAIVSLIR